MEPASGVDGVPPVFGPARLGPLTLRNRIIKSATFEGASPRGEVTDALVAFHERVARGGAAMTTVAYLAVSPEGRTDRHCVLLGEPSVPGLTRLTEAVHAAGALASAQIGHAGPVANSKSNGSPALSPSRRFGASGAPTRAATAADIARITDDYRRGAGTAVAAGFDAIEVHLGHNYLLSSFLSPRLNRRKDDWGGSLEHRARFPRAVVAAVRDGAGPGVAVTAKLNMDDGVPGGFDLPESVDVARMLQDDGHLDALELTGGSSLSNPMYLFRGDAPPGGVRGHPAPADPPGVQGGGYPLHEGVPLRGGLLPGAGRAVPRRTGPAADPARWRQPAGYRRVGLGPGVLVRGHGPGTAARARPGGTVGGGVTGRRPVHPLQPVHALDLHGHDLRRGRPGLTVRQPWAPDGPVGSSGSSGSNSSTSVSHT